MAVHPNFPAGRIELAQAAPRCGARAKSTGKPCQRPACRGRTRCHLHGGRSTGPRTAEGRARLEKIGPATRQAIAASRRARQARRLAALGLEPAAPPGAFAYAVQLIKDLHLAANGIPELGLPPNPAAAQFLESLARGELV